MPSKPLKNKPPTPKPAQSTASPVAEPVVVWQFEAIGTAWWLAVYAVAEPAALTGIHQAVQNRIAAFDAVYSRFRADSQVTAWAGRAGTYPMPTDGLPLFDFYKQLYDSTDAAVTPLIGQTLADAGYDAAYSLQPQTIISRPPAWDETLHYDAAKLILRTAALLDFGAAGKGYLVDIVCELLESYGINAYTVDAGGDLRHCHPSQALRIGLENPADTSQAVGTVELSQYALCGSAGNRRAWAGYHHIIDPHSLASPQHLAAVWVAVKTGSTAYPTMLADGLTTALYFAPCTDLRKRFQFSYAILHTDGSYEISPDFPGAFFIS